MHRCSRPEGECRGEPLVIGTAQHTDGVSAGRLSDLPIGLFGAVMGLTGLSAALFTPIFQRLMLPACCPFKVSVVGGAFPWRLILGGLTHARLD